MIFPWIFRKGGKDVCNVLLKDVPVRLTTIF